MSTHLTGGGVVLQFIQHPAVKAGIILVVAVGVIHLLSGLIFGRVLEYREVACASPKIGGELEGYRMAFLTDIHDYPREKLHAMVEELNRRGVDLVLMGGDFGKKQPDEWLAILADIEAKDGIWGVAGNHDDAGQLAAAMETQGMHYLGNEGAALHPGLYLAGVEDLWKGDPDVEKALEGAGEGDFVLLISHNPDTSMERDFSRTDLALSGHVHGGEVTFFGLWGPAMGFVSNYGQRFRTGMCKSAAGTDVLVSNGIGSHSPLRIFARPQVLLVTLTGA